LDVASAVGIGIGVAMVGALLPTIARRAGLDALGLAVLAATPFVANLLGVFAGWFGPRTSRQVGRIRAAGLISLLGLVLVPHPLMMIAVALSFWLSVSFTVPFQMRLQGTIYPRSTWGRYIGAVGMARAAAVGLSALLGGALADRMGGPQAIALGALIGAGAAVAASRIRAPELATTPAYSVAGSLRALTSRPALRRVALAQGFWGGGLIAAMPLYAFVQVDRLHLSLGEVGLIGALGGVATTTSYMAWGALSDRRGAHLPLRLGGLLGVVSLIAYALAPAASVLWLAAILGGLANAAVDIGIQRSIRDHTTLEARAPAMAGWNAVTGLRGMAAPLVAGTLLGSGLVDAAGGLLLCALVSAAGAVLYFRLPAGQPDRVAAEGRPGPVSLPEPAQGITRGTAIGSVPS